MSVILFAISKQNCFNEQFCPLWGKTNDNFLPFLAVKHDNLLDGLTKHDHFPSARHVSKHHVQSTKDVLDIPIHKLKQVFGMTQAHKLNPNSETKPIKHKHFSSHRVLESTLAFFLRGASTALQ